MSFVFGKTLVCRDLDTVVRLARSSNLDCITLDGEKGSSKGVLTGGYIHPERSRMANYDKYQAIVGKHSMGTYQLSLSMQSQSWKRYRQVISELTRRWKLTKTRLPKVKAVLVSYLLKLEFIWRRKLISRLSVQTRS